VVPPDHGCLLSLDRVLLVTGIGDCTSAEAAAFAYAKERSSTIVALQVLTSNLYHYGHVDLIATRPSKRDFLLYIREEVIGKGKEEAKRLMEVAQQSGVDLEMITIETEDVPSTVVREAQQGYDAVFVTKQKRKIFPLLQKNLNSELKKRASCRVVMC
jgi:hypothetical protein